VLWHILKIYATAQIYTSIIAAGYRMKQIGSAFADSDNVRVVDTGVRANTAGRLLRLAEVLPDTFCLTYADGLSDVLIEEVISLHLRTRPTVTLTAVHPPSRFGELALSGDVVTAFEEKSVLRSAWINGGFMVVDRNILDWIPTENTSLEEDVLPRLAAAGQLMAYRHEGFWHCMDTLSDVKYLNRLWHEGKAPWHMWRGDSSPLL